MLLTISNRSNMLGQTLKLNAAITQQQIYLNVYSQISLIEGDKYQLLVNKFLLKSCSLDLIQGIKDRQYSFITKSLVFLKQQNQISYDKRLCNQFLFDITRINRLYSIYKHDEGYNLRKHAVIKIAEDYLNSEYDVRHKYKCYQFLQYLITISENIFKSQFNIAVIEDIGQLSKYLSKDEIYNIQQLKIRSKIIQYTENSSITIKFFNTFQIEDVPDIIIINFFDNIEHRLQYITASQDFMLIHRVTDRMILKQTMSKEAKTDIEKILQQCPDEYIYDVILRVNEEAEQLQKVSQLKIRYLNLRSQNFIQLTLMHPEYLISVSLQRTRITNIGQCKNLHNIYSEQNKYIISDIIKLQNIKFINSQWDSYEKEGNCFLYDLFQNNKLQYVYIFNWSLENNIIKPIRLHNNISDLRYLYVESYTQCDIILDVSAEYPHNLQIFEVHNFGAEFEEYTLKQSQIYGQQDEIENLKNQLVNQALILLSNE